MNRIKRCQPLLGTYVEITLVGRQSEEHLHREAGEAFDLIGTVSRLMSFHDPESDVSRLNRRAHVVAQEVHPWTFQVIKAAVQLSAETAGAFDITVAPKLVGLGYLPRYTPSNSPDEEARWSDIEIQDDGQIAFHRPLMIDLGGIAKGFAVDQAIKWLATREITRAVVNAGGDLRVHGEGPHEISIRNPAAPLENCVPCEMLRPAVATSAAYFARKRRGTREVNPIVDSATGKSVHFNQSVSVFSPTCMLADALTKVVLLAPQPLWNRVLRDADSLALFITRRGERTIFPS